MSTNLLVVDDEEAVLSLVKTMLTRAQYRVTTCSSAEEALKLLTRGKFDCVITDAIMPNMTGYDFVKALRNEIAWKDLPVLMLTRKRHREDVKKAVEVGVTDYVFKPIDEQLLLEKIELSVKQRGKRLPHEHSVTVGQSDAELRLSCKVMALSESEITLCLPIALDEHTPFQIHSQIFQEIGIPVPSFKFQYCQKVGRDQPHYLAFPFEVKLTFISIENTNREKIREWINIQESKSKN